MRWRRGEGDFSLASWRSSSGVTDLNSALVPSESNALTSNKCSLVLPYTTEFEPHELLPTIPPIIALLAVEVSGPNISPWGFRNIFSSSRITPGCTRTHFSAVFNSSILVKYFETSTIMPLPTTWPARDVPAVLGISEVLWAIANSISLLPAGTDRGTATASGVSPSAEASAAYR